MNDLRMKHTDPSFHGVVVALAVIVVVCGMIEFVRFYSLGRLLARSNGPTVAENRKRLAGYNTFRQR
jgi:hypothetical protein